MFLEKKKTTPKNPKQETPKASSFWWFFNSNVKFCIYCLMELLKCIVLIQGRLAFWIVHYKPDFNRLKTRCDKRFDASPALISAICKEVHIWMEIAPQNGSVWLGPCQSPHKTTVPGKISSHWFSVKAPPSLGKAASKGHQLLSAGNPLWRGMRSRRKLEKAGGYKRGRGETTHQISG